jgi:hypothetical protein
VAVTQEPFNFLLTWLDPNYEVAGRKYALIHSGLVRIFVSRGFSDAEDLADLTIKRVSDLLPGIRDSYVGERAPYFYKVAGYIILEARRRPEIATDLASVEQILENNELVLDYHLNKGRDKIEQHERMAKERGISVEALRSRAHHIRKTLKDCVQQRKKDYQKKRKASWIS